MRTFLVSIFLLFLGACAEEVPTASVVLQVRGAAIDGSEDPKEITAPEVQVQASAVVPEPSEVLTTKKPEEPPTPAKPAPTGPVNISYRDLTLIDYDVDAMLDFMLFPDDYEGEEIQDLQFPANLKALDGKIVSIVGYMIPGEMDQGNVRDFMLVRDLLGCCFGGTPMPDEWLDVVMEDDAEAEYRPYMPTRVTGVLTLGGEQDEAGFALGVYQLRGQEVAVED